MAKCKLQAIQFEKKQNSRLENIYSVTFLNYTKFPAFIKIDSVITEMAPAQMVGTTLVPTSFKHSNKKPFDVVFDVWFETATGKLVAFYFEKPLKC